MFWYIKSDAEKSNNFQIQSDPDPQTLISYTVGEIFIYIVNSNTDCFTCIHEVEYF
jgi:hypothetical protein